MTVKHHHGMLVTSAPFYKYSYLLTYLLTYFTSNCDLQSSYPHCHFICYFLSLPGLSGCSIKGSEPIVLAICF